MSMFLCIIQLIVWFCVDERVDQANVHSITASTKSMFDNFPQSSIYRVPERLRSVKPEAYTPLIVSIGPFHHGDKRLEAMEHRKTQYLHSLLRRHPEIRLDRYVKVLLQLETRARNCYAETIPHTRTEFLQMLLVDGCFLLEIFAQYYCFPSRTRNNDQVFTKRWIFNAVHRDVLLLENQIPFFVLETLFNILTPTLPREIHGLCHLIEVSLGPHKLLGDRDWHIRRLKEEPLLLSVLKSITAFETVREKRTLKTPTTIAQLHSKILCVCRQFKKKFLRVCRQLKKKLLRVCRPFKKKSPLLPIRKKIPNSLTFIPSATELSRVSITFAVSESSNLFDVRFEEKGVFHIPSLVVDDRTEPFLRNLIALEQTHSETTIIKDQNPSHSNKIPTISAYVTLMDCLVNTSTDVALLRDQGILHNQLGDDEEVAQLFNKLRTGMIMNPYAFCFSEVFNNVNVYYKTKWNEWRATFFREIWSTPWKKTSLLAAIFLLLCTFVQTVCSILQVLPYWSN